MILRILNKDVPLRNFLFVIGEGVLIYAAVMIAAFLRLGGAHDSLLSIDLLSKSLLIMIVCQASLYFNDFNDRANFKAALGAINGFMHTTLPGSFLKMSECWHDELLENGSPVKSDEIEFEETIE